MAQFNYVFGDALTGTILEEISLQGVSMTRSFGAGDFRCTFQLDQTGKTNRDLIIASEPGRSYVVCERNASPIWGGIVWTRTYQSQSKTFQLYCKSFEHYPEYRIIRSDFENLNTEQRNIFLNLWTLMQADSNSIKVTLPSPFSTVVQKSLTVKAFEFKKYRTVTDYLSNAIDGFDWTIDVSRVGGAYVKTLRIGYPTLGATNFLDFDYPGQIINYWQNDSMANRGTHIYGLGSGEGSTILSQEVIHSDLLAGNFPRYDNEVSFKDVTDATTLTGLTSQAAIVRKAIVPILTIEVKGNLEPEFGSYGLGDAVRVHFNDPRHINHVDRTYSSRIIGWEYYPSSDDHVEYVRIALEGEE